MTPVEITAWATKNGWTKDSYGNLKKISSGIVYRIKLQKLNLRIERKGVYENADVKWEKLSSAYYRDAHINTYVGARRPQLIVDKLNVGEI